MKNINSDFVLSAKGENHHQHVKKSHGICKQPSHPRYVINFWDSSYCSRKRGYDHKKPYLRITQKQNLTLAKSLSQTKGFQRHVCYVERRFGGQTPGQTT